MKDGIDRESFETGCLSALILSALGWMLVLLILAGCSPRIVERIVVQHDTTTVHHRDTSHCRDSIYIREWMKGDTVYVDRFRDRYVFRDRWRDSVSVREVHDTTSVEVPVEKSLTGWQRFRIGAFWWLLALVAFAYRRTLARWAGLLTKKGRE